MDDDGRIGWWFDLYFQSFLDPETIRIANEKRNHRIRSFGVFSFKRYGAMKLQFYRNNITANDLLLTFQLSSIYHSPVHSR